jgi:ubiquinone/menaquinone biosynthesis C-methylase UbiE
MELSEMEAGCENADGRPNYASAEYWNERYRQRPEPFEWYQEWAVVYRAVKEHCASARRALNVGCGSSPMAWEMSAYFEHVVNIDISSVVIDQMAEAHKQAENVEWIVMDCTKMTFEDNSFDIAFDKGTIDALLCAESSATMIAAITKEVWRVLKADGLFFEITYGAPFLRNVAFASIGPEWKRLDPVRIENPRRHNDHWIYGFQEI